MNEMNNTNNKKMNTMKNEHFCNAIGRVANRTNEQTQDKYVNGVYNGGSTKCEGKHDPNVVAFLFVLSSLAQFNVAWLPCGYRYRSNIEMTFN